MTSQQPEEVLLIANYFAELHLDAFKPIYHLSMRNAVLVNAKMSPASRIVRLEWIKND